MPTSTKVKVKTAKSELNTFYFNFAHGTTNKFYEPSIPFCMEVNKQSELELEMSTMRRVDPMPLPPMSNVTFRTRFFYVPYIDICPYWEHFDSQTPYAFRYGPGQNEYHSMIPQGVPVIRTLEIKKLLFGSLKINYIDGAPAFTSSGSSEYLVFIDGRLDGTPLINVPHDIAIIGEYTSNNTTVTGVCRYKFTKRGRIFYKLLKQLGYDFNLNKTDKIKNKGYDYENASTMTFSAMKMLAFLKVYLDYYENSAYYNNTIRLAELNGLCHIDAPNYEMNKHDIDLIVDLATYMTYENDYFTTNFVNPSNGNNFLLNNQAISMQDPTMTDNPNTISASNSNSGTPKLSFVGGLSKNALNMLNSLTSYLKRQMIAGGRAVDRILTEYGVSVNNAYSRRTSYIDTIESTLSITPVINTTSEQLGDYAGYGSSGVNKNNKITIKIPEITGVVIAIDTITPEIFYSQGYLRENRHITKFDFLTPEFDAVGVQATEQGEILNLHDGTYGYQPDAQTFGYKPRYAECKERYSLLTGDFIVDTVNTDIESFFTDRRFNPESYQNNNTDKLVSINVGREFCATYEGQQYERIFYFNEQHTDYIKSIFRFKLKMTAPMKKLYSEYELNDYDGNSEVSMHIGGQTMK